MQKQATSLAVLLVFAMQITYAQVTPPSPYSGTAPVNYIRTWDAVKPSTDPNDFTVASNLQVAKMTTEYYDGLGRKIQKVVKQGSWESNGTAKDLVSAIVYDEFGREIYNYLPFAANNTGGNTSITDGLFKLNPFQQQATFAGGHFLGETFFYGKKNYEASPLNRVISTYAPGNSWVGSENAINSSDRKGVNLEYLINTASDSVRIWNVNSSGITSSSTAYPAGQLYKNLMVDENKQKIIEYKDKTGNIVLRKVQVSPSTGEGHSGWLCTYYVYDDLNLLRMVLPPLATKKLHENSWTLTLAIADGLCFRYEYDGRARPIVKKVPGSEEIRMVYDARDRMVLSQDGKQRALHKWFYTKYDGLNRQISNGLITDNSNYNNHNWHRGQSENSTDYPNLSSYTHEELTSTFYDDYSWRSSYGNPLSSTLNTTHSTHLLTASNSMYPYPQSVTQAGMNQTRVTGSRAKILGTNEWLYTVNFYDEKGRVIQVQSQNSTGGVDIVTNQFSWNGLPLLNIQAQQKNGTNAQTTVVITKLTYDELGRLAHTEKKVSNSKINGGSLPGSWTRISENEYDALGQLKNKSLGNNLESLVYDYNIRYWLLGINRQFVNDNATNYFGFELAYDKTASIISGSNYTNAQYNGNVAGILWKGKGDGEKRKYDFTYDASNRLLQADFTQYTGGTFNKTAGIDYSLKMGNGVNSDSAYDYNGNILRMQQWGLKGLVNEQIDDLRYTYSDNSNLLKNVIDIHNDPLTVNGDFRSSQVYMAALGGTKTNLAVDYTYDGNGNLLKDLNKDITDDSYAGIEYNYLNLPSIIRVKNKGTVEYQYDATGNKIKKTVKETGKPDKVTLYLSGLVFENDTLQLIAHEEGRMRPVGDSIIAYDYFIKDHLNNIRAMITNEERANDAYQASIEDNRREIETQLFADISETEHGKPVGFDSDGGNAKVSRLFSSSGTDKRVGPSLLLKVMAGDKFRAGVKGWYLPGGTNTSTVSGIDNIILPLINAFVGGMPAGPGKSAALSGTGNSALNTSLGSFLSSEQGSPGSRPKAYLNWMVLDEQMLKLVPGSYGAIQIPEITGTMERQSMLANGGNEIVVNKNGYLYVYVSNESQGNVYFDDLIVAHTQGPLLQESHYYPYGLAMKRIGSNALAFGGKENKHRFNGYEQQSEEFSDGSGLEWYDYKNRFYDNQLGRFFSTDRLADKFPFYTPYQFAGNEPTVAIDLDGLEPEYIASKNKSGEVKLNLPVIAMYAKLYGQSYWNAGGKTKLIIDQSIHDRITGYNTGNNGGGAITLGYDVNYSGDYANNTSGEEWLKLTSHEIVHVQQFIDMFGDKFKDKKDYEKAVGLWMFAYGIDAFMKAVENRTTDANELHDKIEIEKGAGEKEKIFENFFDSQDYTKTENGKTVSGNKVIDLLMQMQDASKKTDKTAYTQAYNDLMKLVDEFNSKNKK